MIVSVFQSYRIMIGQQVNTINIFFNLLNRMRSYFVVYMYTNSVLPTVFMERQNTMQCGQLTWPVALRCCSAVSCPDQRRADAAAVLYMSWRARACLLWDEVFTSRQIVTSRLSVMLFGKLSAHENFEPVQFWLFSSDNYWTYLVHRLQN